MSPLSSKPTSMKNYEKLNDSRRSSMSSLSTTTRPAHTTRSTSTSTISKTSSSSTSPSHSNSLSRTTSRSKKVKTWFKRVGNGMLDSLAYANAVEYSPQVVQYYERKRGERTPDEVLNDVYGAGLFCYW